LRPTQKPDQVVKEQPEPCGSGTDPVSRVDEIVISRLFLIYNKKNKKKCFPMISNS